MYKNESGYCDLRNVSVKLNKETVDEQGEEEQETEGGKAPYRCVEEVPCRVGCSAPRT